MLGREGVGSVVLLRVLLLSAGGVCELWRIYEASYSHRGPSGVDMPTTMRVPGLCGGVDRYRSGQIPQWTDTAVQRYSSVKSTV